MFNDIKQITTRVKHKYNGLQTVRYGRVIELWELGMVTCEELQNARTQAERWHKR